MATGNFYPHENGIFTIRLNSFEDVKEWMAEDNRDISEDLVYDEMYYVNSMLVEEFFSEDLIPMLEDKGYEVNTHNNDTISVWRNNKIVAELSLKSGYYEGVQVIAETDKDYLIETYVGYLDTVKEEIENYTPHNKTLFNVLRNVTDEYVISARFSNGETWYSKAS